ncbi:hypothetical protein EV13_1008 [Prochlorococcus sp. MIT 0702]|nr:hypothetical protein EV13_1008 [Prochlorococcus sp. MIT 0702]
MASEMEIRGYYFSDFFCELTEEVIVLTETFNVEAEFTMSELLMKLSS